MDAPHILSVSYNEPLLRTREMLLARDGYSVTSALGFTASVQHCKRGSFDLFILGHSIPEQDKQELIRLFRDQCNAPILALRRDGENEADGADAHIYPDDIKGLLEAVATMLLRKKSTAGSDTRPSVNKSAA